MADDEKRIAGMDKILFFDTETTGLPKDRKKPPRADPSNWPRLVEIAWAVGSVPVEPRAEWSDYQQGSYLILPDGWEIPEEATATHGIKIEDCLRDGVPFCWALAELEKSLDGVGLVVAHNAEFDLSVVEAECLRYRLPNVLAGRKVFCTKEESTYFCNIPGKWRGRPRRPSLGDLYQKLFEEEVPEAHRADADVKTLVECYWGLRKTLSVRE